MFLYHGERFSEQGKASGSCEKLLDGYTLLLMAFNEEAEGAVRPTWPYGTKCTRSGLHWLRAKGRLRVQCRTIQRGHWLVPESLGDHG